MQSMNPKQLSNGEPFADTAFVHTCNWAGLMTVVPVCDSGPMGTVNVVKNRVCDHT